MVLLVLCSLFIGACSKNKPTAKLVTNGKRTPWKKNPPSVPVTPNPVNPNPQNPTPVDPQVVRGVVTEFKLSQLMSEKLYELNYYAPDNCVQWVKMTKGGTLIGHYLEISNTFCPGTGPVDDNSVLLRLKIEQDKDYATQFHLIYEQSASPEIGMIRKLVTDNVTAYELEGLCDLDPSGWDRGWSTYCSVSITESKWANPPLEMQNLD